MKPTLLWSLVALCGVVGGGVALHGGWSQMPHLRPIQLVRTVWVTNEITLATPWVNPVKPNTYMWIKSPDGVFAINFVFSPAIWTYATNYSTRP